MPGRSIFVLRMRVNRPFPSACRIVPRTGRKPKLKSQVKPLVDEILGTSRQGYGYPQTSWTAALVRFHLKQARGMDASEATLWRVHLRPAGSG